MPEPSDPWEEVEPGWDDGNGRHFKAWVIVLLPATQCLSFLAENTSPEDLQSRILRLSKALEHSDNVVPQNGTNTPDELIQQSHEELRKELDVVCACAMDKMQSCHNIGLTSYLYHHDNPKFTEALEAVLRASMILGNIDLVRKAMSEYPTKLSPALWREVGSRLDRSTLIKYKYG